MAGNLADPFLSDTSKSFGQKGIDQLLAEANIKVVRYQSLQTEDPVIRRIASEAANAGASMIESQQTLETLSRDDGFNDFVMGALGLYLGDPNTIIMGASGLLQKGDARQQERIKWASAFNRSRIAQLMLPEAAKGYAPSPGGTAQLLGVDIDESFAGLADHDSITLTNKSGQTLNHCTVLVELHGRSGEVCQNVHYIEKWERSARHSARYGIGVASDSGVFGRRTVHGIQDAYISFWSDEFSQERLRYIYPGSERDADIQAALDGKLLVMYRYDEPSLFSIGPNVLVSLKGVPMIPAHRLTLSVTPPKNSVESKTVSLYWDQSEWFQDQNRIVDLGTAIKFRPDSMEIRVTFPDSNYVYRRLVTLNQR